MRWTWKTSLKKHLNGWMKEELQAWVLVQCFVCLCQTSCEDIKDAARWNRPCSLTLQLFHCRLYWCYWWAPSGSTRSSTRPCSAEFKDRLQYLTWIHDWFKTSCKFIQPPLHISLFDKERREERLGSALPCFTCRGRVVPHSHPPPQCHCHPSSITLKTNRTEMKHDFDPILDLKIHVITDLSGDGAQTLE